MMDIRQLSEDFSVCPQINADDLQTIWDAGFRSLICNRPDDEEAGQPRVADVKAAALELGLEFTFIPVSSIADTSGQVAETRQVLAGLAKPVLAYCRSGTRCTVIWSQMQLGVMPPREILAATAAAGYDMRQLVAP